MATFPVFVFLVFIVFLTPPAVVGFSVDEFRDTGVADVIFSASFISQHSLSSDLACARLCAFQGCCLSFTFSPDGSCRLHSADVTSPMMPSSPLPGARAWRLDVGDIVLPPADWLHLNCSKDSECPAENSICYLNECLCEGGFYYAEDTHTCTATCAFEDLTDTFIRYRNVQWDAYCSTSQLFSTLPLCYLICTIQSWCHTTKLYPLNNEVRCYLTRDTALDHPGLWITNASSQYEYHQRTCGVAQRCQPRF